jgi:hypothetical protein
MSTYSVSFVDTKILLTARFGISSERVTLPFCLIVVHGVALFCLTVDNNLFGMHRRVLTHSRGGALSGRHPQSAFVLMRGNDQEDPILVKILGNEI